MFVRKKYIVQKSFRIDEEVERDLSILSQITDRSQNDLVNVAIMELLQDNKDYFINTSVLEYFQNQMNLGAEILEPFEMGGLRVEVKYCENGVRVRGIVKDGENIIDDYTREFESDISEEFEDYLIGLHIYIDRSSEDVKKYLGERTDYRSYVKVRNADSAS